MSNLKVKAIPTDQRSTCGYVWGLYEGHELIGRFECRDMADRMRLAFETAHSDKLAANSREAHDE